jgi:ribonuclease HI
MSDSTFLKIHTDGAARGNPGPAACAYVIERPDGLVIEEAGCLGEMTNNQAEYLGLLRALEHAAQLGTQHRLQIFSDSELMVKQMNGEYRVKSPDLRSFYEQARQLWDRFSSVSLRHVRREQNSHADRLCNEALDGKRSWSALPKPDIAPPPPQRDGTLRDKAVRCLTEAAAAWALGGDPKVPPPADVWEKLWGLVMKEEVSRS